MTLAAGTGLVRLLVLFSLPSFARFIATFNTGSFYSLTNNVDSREGKEMSGGGGDGESETADDDQAGPASPSISPGAAAR